MTTVLSDDVLTRFDALVSRRLTRQPLQYLLHTQPFLGRDFYVDERVLIPRPETELLAERAIAALREHPHPIALDLCCGSGALAVSMSLEVPGAQVHAADLSPDALGGHGEERGTAWRVRHPASRGFVRCRAGNRV